jgi:hypothetical protein
MQFTERPLLALGLYCQDTKEEECGVGHSLSVYEVLQGFWPLQLDEASRCTSASWSKKISCLALLKAAERGLSD